MRALGSEQRGPLQRLASAYVALAARRGWLLLGLGFGLALLGGLGVSRLSIDPRVEAMLPAGTPSLVALEELEARRSEGPPLYFVIESEDPPRNRRIAAHLLEEVERWPETRWALRRRDPDFFLRNLLLYLPEGEIRALTGRVEESLDWYECEAIPGCVNFDERPEAPSERELAELLLERSEMGELIGVLGGEAARRRILAGAAEAPAEAAAEEGAEESAEESAEEGATIGELCSPDGQVCVVQAIIRGDASDSEFAIRIAARAEALIASTQASMDTGSARIVTSGRYRDVPRIRQAAAEDVQASGLLSVCLVLLVLFLHLRGPRALLLLVLPILAATGWTVGLIALLHPRLNLMSALILVVLAGLGVDYGVHLLTHYGHKRAEGRSPREAVEQTLCSLLGSTTAAAASTGVVFVALGFARFEGLRELGPLAALGILMAFLATALLFPPLVLLAHAIRPESVSPVRRWPSPRLGPPSRRLSRALAPLALALALLAGLYGYSGLELESDMGRLQPEAISHGINWGSATHGMTRTSFYLLADDPEELSRAMEGLAREAEDPPEALPELRVIGLGSFLPTDQEARLQAIAELRAAVRRARARIGPSEGDRLSRVERLLEPDRPLIAEDLPRWVRSWFEGREGRPLDLGVAFVALSARNVEHMEGFSRELARLRRSYPGVHFASTAALLGEATIILRGDAPVLLTLAILAAFLTALVAGRSLKIAGKVLVPLVVAAGWALGAMAALDLHVNFYNLMVFPLAFGVGVDGAVFLVWAEGKDRGAWWEEIKLRARAILVSGLTTMAALGSLAVGSNPGIRSIAYAAILCLCAALAALLLWFPLLLVATGAGGADGADGARPGRVLK